VGLTTVVDVDVTSVATFESSNAAAATVSGSTLTGRGLTLVHFSPQPEHSKV